MKKGLCLAVTVVCAAVLFGCGSSKQSDVATVRYLNFKPEVADVWEEIAATYESETGVKVDILNAPSNGNEKTLQAAIGKKNPPTLFQINGPVGYQQWKAYCSDLKDTDLYSWVVDKDMVITGEDGGVYGIPYVVEGYGIIYNDEIMQKYFALGNKGTSYTSMDQIKSFQALKEVTEDMTAHKGELGIKGVFASTSFQTGEDWRWQTHLLNIPLYYEYQDKQTNDAAQIDFTYASNMQNIFDLYLNNSTCERTEVGQKSVADSMSEFALGQCAMVQNGNWAWSQIAGTEGNVVSEDNCKFLPIYIGAPGEETSGIAIGTECYMSVNNLCTEEEQQASVAFLEWLFGTETGKQFVTNDLQFITVFNTFSDDEIPSNPLAREVSRYLKDESLTSVSWNFTTFPSQTFKDGVSENLYAYAIGKQTFDDCKTYVVSEWNLEKGGATEANE